MSKIRVDAYSPYLKVGGYIFRPVFPVGYSHRHADGTAFSLEGDVKARHIGGSQMCKAKQGGVEEWWFSHGAYLGDPSYAGSESCWKPDYEHWPEKAEPKNT